MLHRKYCTDIYKALEFVNTHKVIPISVQYIDKHVTVVIYEAIEIPEPNNHEIDLLKETYDLITNIHNVGVIHKDVLASLQTRIAKCLNLQ